MPDLSNVQFLERGLNWSTLAYIVFVCLAAASSFILALFAGRVTSAKELELNRLQSTSAEAVARAHASTARANAQAQAAYKEKRRLEVDMARAQVRHAELHRENLQLQLAVENERTARLELEQRLAARRLAVAQRQTIQSELAAFQGQKVSIATYPGDAEGAAFAGDLKETLTAAGVVANPAPALMAGKPQPGIALEVGANRRAFATALAKAFVDAGISSGPVYATESEDPNLLEITVGPKP